MDFIVTFHPLQGSTGCNRSMEHLVSPDGAMQHELAGARSPDAAPRSSPLQLSSV
ncbi:hypothetical protein WME91_38240 [Sorangium sp. So ce269]